MSASKLQYDCQEISDERWPEISTAIKGCVSLTCFSILGADVGDSLACALAEALACAPCISHINMGCNRIGDSGAYAFARLLAGNQSIEVLNMMRNDIGSEGARHLGWALAHNDVLRYLNLSNNESLGDAGVTDLAIGLKCNASMTTLLISSVGMTRAAARHLFKAVEKNTTLTDLGLAFEDMPLPPHENIWVSKCWDTVARNERMARNMIKACIDDDIVEVCRCIDRGVRSDGCKVYPDLYEYVSDSILDLLEERAHARQDTQHIPTKWPMDFDDIPDDTTSIVINGLI